MPTTNFTPGTVVTSTWLNEVDAVTFGLGSTTAGEGAGLVSLEDGRDVQTALEDAEDRLTALEVASGAGNSLIMNGELQNVVRNGGALPPTSLVANQFLIDRWKAGSAGMTRSGSLITGTVSWTAGTLVQVIQDFNSDFTAPLRPTTPVICAWSGTAVVRFNGGAWQTSPATYTPAGIETTLTIEFGLNGAASSATLSEPRAFIGTVDSGFVHKTKAQLAPLLEQYYKRVSVLHQVVPSAGSQQFIWSVPHGRMATAATPVAISSTLVNCTVSYSTGTLDTFYVTMTSTAAGNARVTSTVELDTGF